MKGIALVFIQTIKQEFGTIKNQLGWMMTGLAWIAANMKDVNEFLAGALTLVSIIWLMVKIYYAVKNGGNKE